MFDYRAQLLTVHDGDTITMLLDTGFSNRTEQALRLKGVFAPELNTPGGPETRQFVLDWLAQYRNLMLKWPFYVVTEKTTTTEPTEVRTFTRYVATVYDYQPMKHCLNDDINTFLAGHPEWGHGTGG